MDDLFKRAERFFLLALVSFLGPLLALEVAMTAGKAVQFLLLGIVNAYFGLWLLGYATYWFILVLDETASGTRDVKVVWPDDNFRQRLWKLGHLAFLVIIWALPVIVAFRYAELPLRSTSHSLLVVFTVGVVLWVMMPISLLSSMTGDTHWEFFRWFVIRRLLDRFPTWMAFYAYTFPLLVGCALVAHLALFGWVQLRAEAETSGPAWLITTIDVWSWGFVLPLTAVMAATALLIYARLLGRLAWMADFWDDEEEEEDASKLRGPRSPAPSRLRAEHDVLEPAPAVEPAGMIPFAQEPQPAAAPRPIKREPEKALSPVAESPDQASTSGSTPKRLWIRGIYLFPWYRGSLRAWLFLSFFGLLFGILLRLQLRLWS